MKIVLLGSGNVATRLGKALQAAGHEVLEVWSRSLANAAELAEHLQTKSTDQLNSITGDADLYITAVSDAAIETVATDFPHQKKLLVHTSGTTGLISPRISGVFYPVQTFSKNKEVGFSQIPIAVEGKDPEVTKVLLSLAGSISNNVRILNSDQRRTLHVAAVFASNFSNHLYAIADELLTEEGIDFDLLKPLILETAQKIQTLSPNEAQTGPAVRQDSITISRHLKVLETKPHLKQLYENLSQSIINLNQKA